MLGARLVFDLINRGYKVRAIYRSKKRIDQFAKNIGFYTQLPNEYTQKVEWLEADMLEYPSLIDAVEGVDIVFHSAAMVSFYAPDYPTMYEINIHGTASLVNACLEKKVKKICFVSSIAALGKKEDGGLIDETTQWVREKNHSGYGISKFHSEMEIWRGVNEGLEAVVVNPSVILGPGEWQSGSPAFFNNIAKGMKFYPSGETGFVDVRDVSAAMVLLCNADNWERSHNKKFLLNATNLRYQEVFTKIASSLNVKAPSKKAIKPLLEIAWRLAWIGAKLTNNKPLITKGNARSASKTQHFDGTKITNEFRFRYRPIDQTISEIGQCYLNDNKIGHQN